ncbi:Deoxyguanosinetriphosphate triphosphohydrolase-like protein [Paenibacillus plantiphilus]|uniref:Deoxyguanosinetriphosphate triphosphohydrolase-like protein n=1 Tax=Paenibacillus plantiphilus TaxID=2905650 RepID=A0ABM9CT21_9BACL|nr:dNTP triphosphohydrolase [Paenibacillus plantiphilus]CAH1221914.1 Deoxyguanosinetriphosphate triphosphohydrolase-like protein [Paenibacillus plantiphilus]
MNYNERTLDYVRASLARSQLLDFRLHADQDDGRVRDEYSRDYARVLYSSSFRRLQGKMQLLGIDHNLFFRNRLTHSMEVSQIARGIAIDLNIGNTFVVEACSLAHDLGNPPIGHYGERVLCELVADIGGFEGNAQTLRILRKLEQRHHAYRGMNLLFRTQLGVVKYFRRYDQGANSKFIYDEDYEDIRMNLEMLGLGEQEARTIEMEIMDLADEIAYAAHDLEDSLSQNLFSVDELLFEFSVAKDYGNSYETFEGMVNRCREFARKGEGSRSSEEYSFLFRKELTSTIVNTLIRDIAYQPQKQGLGFTQFGLLSKGLKKLVFQLINRRPSVHIYERKGEKVLRGLYEVYTDERLNPQLMLLPPEYRGYATDEERRRNVVDFISGMMDHFAMQEFGKYFGSSELDKLV